MSSIIRWRNGVMTRSVAEEEGAETALILAQQGRRVSEVKRMIGEGDERLSGGSQAVELGGGRGFGCLPRSGLVQRGFRGPEKALLHSCVRKRIIYITDERAECDVNVLIVVS